jgi:hypothetical protein
MVKSAWLHCISCRSADVIADTGGIPDRCGVCGQTAVSRVGEAELAKLVAASDLLRVRSPVSPRDVSPPSPDELRGDVLLFDITHAPLLDGSRTGVPNLPWVRWTLAGFWSLCVILILVFAFDPGEVIGWIFLVVAALPTLALDLWLVLDGRDRIALRRHGTVLRGIAECVDARVVGDADEYFELVFGVKFETPDGIVVGLALPDHQLVDRVTLRGSTANRASPLPPGRCPVAVLWTARAWRAL